METIILSHRGLDICPLNSTEEERVDSRYADFEALMARGLGVEADVWCLSDGCLVISHGNPDKIENFQDFSQSIHLKYKRCSFDDILYLHNKYESPLLALHLKADMQLPSVCEKIVAGIMRLPVNKQNKILLFDLTVSAARFFKSRLPSVNIGASVSHKYDISRYGRFVGGTLFSVEDVLVHRGLFDWIWMDEWDLVDFCGKKEFICRENINFFQSLGFKVAGVSPELHAKSPGLLGGEEHPDGVCPVRVKRRVSSWITTGINAICTDYANWINAELHFLEGKP